MMNLTTTLQPEFARLRRTRRTVSLRRLTRESQVAARNLILPLFVSEVDVEPVEVVSMPGVNRWPLSHIGKAAMQADAAGLGAVLLFGIPEDKDVNGTGASAADGIVQRAIGEIRGAGYSGVLITDVCLCEFTTHGHCGLVDERGTVLNDPTLDRLGEIAVSHGHAGADIVAPSSMMDGQVSTIRNALDSEELNEVAILSYSAKYASAYYGPFRDAADGSPQFGDRRSHQMDPANAREALREHQEDIAEGADMLMVKPGLSYLDVLRKSRDNFPDYPIAAYNVSGEYSMVKAAAERGWLDEREVVLESLLAFRRAGADLIITYHALDAAAWMAAADE